MIDHDEDVHQEIIVETVSHVTTCQNLVALKEAGYKVKPATLLQYDLASALLAAHSKIRFKQGPTVPRDILASAISSAFDDYPRYFASADDRHIRSSFKSIGLSPAKHEHAVIFFSVACVATTIIGLHAPEPWVDIFHMSGAYVDTFKDLATTHSRTIFLVNRLALDAGSRGKRADLDGLH